MKTVLLLVCSGLLLTASVQATIINVPTDQPTIQAGIEAASSGDTVLVQPGRYVENIELELENKAIVIGSLFLTTGDTSYVSQTIIDGNNKRTVVKFNQPNYSPAVLIGFTITNGRARFAGGVECKDTNVNLVNLKVIGNWSIEGGGIFCEKSNVNLVNVNVNRNEAEYGGVISCFSSTMSMDNVTVSGNTYKKGGAIFCGENSNVNMVNSTVSENKGDCSGAIQVSGGTMSLSHVTVTKNETPSNDKGAIDLREDASVSLLNSILWDNSQEEIAIDERSVTAMYCNIQGGWDGLGNIDADPLFLNAADGDYRLSDSSPCIGTGIDSIEVNETWYHAPTKDCEGTSRPCPTGSRPDIGAHESAKGIPVKIEDRANLLPESFVLHQNYPNPFNPTTTIEYVLPVKEYVQIQIIDILGREIRRLVDEEINAGTHEVIWNGRDDLGNPVVSGIYLCRMRTGSYQKTIRMLLLK